MQRDLRRDRQAHPQAADQARDAEGLAALRKNRGAARGRPFFCARRATKITAKQRTITPVDGSVYATRTLASGAAIDRALARSVDAQRSWKQVPVAERAALVRRMADWCVARAGELA
ncbi:MAG: aldehyde dehydrogenase family protein, partial [Burkholderiales bacterium]